jgi:hypothetical protein
VGNEGREDECHVELAWKPKFGCTSVKNSHEKSQITLKIEGGQPNEVFNENGMAG